MTMNSDTTTVILNGAESVRAKVTLASGKLTVSGGAESLMEGTFSYADPAWKPVVAYDVQAGVGKLKVKQPNPETPLHGDPKYVWDLVMGDAVPLDFAVKLASGSANLRMANTRLSKLDVKVASGNVQADLTGDLGDLTRVSLKSASGRAGLVMDGTYPVLESIDLSGASGATDVKLSGDYPALRKIDIGSASGKVRIMLNGSYSALEKLSIKLASGAADLDLSEFVHPHGEVSVDCVSGKATVTVPGDAPVVIRFTAMSGKLVAPGFHKVGKDYVNDVVAAGETERMLHLSMSTVSGKLVVRTAEDAGDAVDGTAAGASE